MDPITWATALQVLRKYWWVLVLIVLAIYIWTLRSGITARDEVIEGLKQTIVLKDAELRDIKGKVDAQNKAIEELAQKGKEQADKLNAAIVKVNAMKPATQVIIREIYTDKSKDVNELLLHALDD